MEKLINKFNGENSELYILIENNRYKFGDCNASFEIWEKHIDVPILAKDVGVKETHIVISLGECIACTRGQGLDALQKARSLELLSELVREDGKHERVTINIQPNEIDLDTGTWECEVLDHSTKQKLIHFR